MQETVEKRLITVRSYRSDDAEATHDLFVAAIMEIASADYSQEQTTAWAKPEHRDLVQWDAAMRRRDSIVAVIEGTVVGFSDVSLEGYIDMMFVSPRHTRRGVASALLAFLEDQAANLSLRELSANVSVTARPFFERNGFVVEAQQYPVTGGVQMTNFRMRKVLAGAR